MRSSRAAHAALALACLAVQPGAARADFRLASGQPATALPPSPSAPGGGDAPRAAPDTGERARAVPPRPRTPVAEGFGTSVPLGFAVRQIVPSAVAVRFGEGVDPAQPVTWSGGQPWHRVLAAAVQPLGLRVVAGTGSVLIRR